MGKPPDLPPPQSSVKEETKEFTRDSQSTHESERKEISSSSLFSSTHYETPQTGSPLKKKALTIKWNEGFIDRVIGAKKIRLGGRPFRSRPLLSRRNLIEAFIYATITALIVRGFLLESFHVPSMSMATALLSGDYVFVSKLAFGIRVPFTDMVYLQKAPKVGEVIVFRLPETGEYHMKRVVGLPGDTIQVDRGRITRNGVRVEVTTPDEQKWSDHGMVTYREHFSDSVATPMLLPVHGSVPSSDPVVVEEGELFVMGDNRAQSEDSRHFGPIARSNVIGKAKYIWLSLQREPSWRMRLERLGEVP